MFRLQTFRSFLYSILFFITCPIYSQQVAQLHYKNYQIQRSLPTDSSINTLLQPYADSLSIAMKKVIGFSTATWYKKQPESLLGNFMADCMKSAAEKAFKTDIDVAIMNYGGIRSYMPKGDITLETIYDLMPFDNAIVLQKVKGNILHQLLDLMANKGGWPCAGISIKIKNKTATDIFIHGSTLQDSAVYTVAISDYLANGGEQCSMLKNIPQQNVGCNFRDALISYVESFTSAGKPVSSKLDNREMYDVE